MKTDTSGVNECIHFEVPNAKCHEDPHGAALCRRQQLTKTFSNIRRAERKMIRELLAPGGVVQVFGPPMVGKASIVQQVVQELQLGSPEVRSHVIQCRHRRLSDVLIHLMSSICPNTVIDPDSDFHDSSSRERMVQEIRTSLDHGSQYLLVFEKCEGLKASESEFVTWVGSLTDLWRAHHIKVSTILTTYKQFRITRRDVSLVEVGVLTDTDDISTLLQDTAPGLRVEEFIPECRRSLCLPECVFALAKEYLAKECVAKESVAKECLAIKCLGNDETRLSTDMVALVAPTDFTFLSDVFVARLMDVETWISRDDLQLLLMPGQATFQAEALLEHVHCKHPNDKVKDLLHRYAYAIEPNHYRLHPLLTFYCRTFPSLQAGTTSQRLNLGNRHNRYLQHILGMAELYTQLNGRPGHAYGCLQQEWPEIRDMIKNAAISQADTYHTFLEVAVKARRLLGATSTNMAKDFYFALLEEAKQRGTPGQCAVLLGVCGHLSAQGAGANLQQAGEMLDSAIDALKQNGVRYFLKCALVRKAIVLFRQGDHPHSLEYFSKARSITTLSEECTDEVLKVSKLQEEEEDLTAEIYETIPMIFSGNNVEARDKLNQLKRKLKEKSFDHPELSTLLNNIGLTFQRGNKDSRAALKWYKKAYLERRHLERICPESLVVMLNNIGMIHYELKELDTAKTYIRKAVEIGRSSRWPHSNTALALVHLSIINFKE